MKNIYKQAKVKKIVKSGKSKKNWVVKKSEPGVSTILSKMAVGLLICKLWPLEQISLSDRNQEVGQTEVHFLDFLCRRFQS